MDDFREQFLIESRDLLAEAADHLLALDRNPQATASIDGAFRAIHTLKGSVALFALRPAERVLHAAEDLMERARKGTNALDAPTIGAVTACLDQIDRWIDQFERSGILPEGAETTAQACLSSLDRTQEPADDDRVQQPIATERWFDELVTREAEFLPDDALPLTAFRYKPDADCFFRGDDPLATVGAVPDLVRLAVLPDDDRWPDADAIEPFACFSVLEGLSAAPLEAVRATFHMMLDQVAFAVLERLPEADDSSPVTGQIPVNRSFRVDPTRVDALGDAVSELVVAVNGFAALADDVERADRALAARARAYQANLERVTGNLALSLSAVRSVPLEQALRRLPRLVREIGESLDKSVEFTIEGQHIEVDRQLADGLFEPLLHLVRNAIDHGIESRAKRPETGKSPIGKVMLRFTRERDRIIADLSDDGAGMDPDALRRIALERGLIGAQAAAMLGDAAALRLILLPGFSTAGAVTELSGRGVGMDAVQTAVGRMRGTVEIDSEPGSGTRFRLSLPATTLTTRLLVIEADGARYGVELDQIVETTAIDKVKLVPIGTGVACIVQGQTVPVLDLAVLLGGSQSRRPDAKLVIVRSGGDPVALRVDAFAQRIDTVVRPSSGMLAHIPGVIGSTLMSDGGVLLVLDLAGLAA